MTAVCAKPLRLPRAMAGLLGILAVVTLSSAMAQSASQDAEMSAEIDFLIDSVGRDGCRFVRNERTYRGRDARAHLRSKRRRNAHLFDSTEEFIEKLASSSATSGAAYLIRCRDEPEQSAQVWFSNLLMQYRQRPAR